MSWPVIPIDHEVFRRYENNPVLTHRDFPWRMRSVYNSSAVKTEHKNARSPYIMITRCNQVNMETLMWPADSDDGLSWKLRDQPYKVPDTPEWDYAASLVYYDPRITWIDDEYKVLVACQNPRETRVACFTSPDLETLTFSHWFNAPDNRNMVLFPGKTADGRYIRLERPNLASAGGKGNIWMSFSPDLVHWGDSYEVLRNTDMPLYCDAGLGPSTVPYLTDEGWLMCFHAIMNNATTREYTVGAAILDRDEPWKVRHVTKYPVLWPEADYEMTGHVEHVCFPCSQIVEPDGSVKLYYGGADYVQCVAIAQMDDLMRACREW
ncbi:glycoside hydrolase family 130 protein [Mucisphaera calidilacus]|uniref:Beta-1,4-mannooligosaccharide phosphorylase n=1 Tax=Mucisphaera calidilacus TaxID=2527982 RepID=A0A518BWZ3_9BACT|nr:hypothetical protein [Mucisphaera calidilacus]QDU71497.1 Beta-1,4-mannooligosaccharide phosphorylase [Mucisphaera calidilacus]